MQEEQPTTRSGILQLRLKIPWYLPGIEGKSPAGYQFVMNPSFVRKMMLDNDVAEVVEPQEPPQQPKTEDIRLEFHTNGDVTVHGFEDSKAALDYLAKHEETKHNYYESHGHLSGAKGDKSIYFKLKGDREGGHYA